MTPTSVAGDYKRINLHQSIADRVDAARAKTGESRDAYVRRAILAQLQADGA